MGSGKDRDPFEDIGGAPDEDWPRDWDPDLYPWAYNCPCNMGVLGRIAVGLFAFGLALAFTIVHSHILFERFRPFIPLTSDKTASTAAALLDMGGGGSSASLLDSILGGGDDGGDGGAKGIATAVVAKVDCFSDNTCERNGGLSPRRTGDDAVQAGDALQLVGDRTLPPASTTSGVVARHDSQEAFLDGVGEYVERDAARAVSRESFLVSRKRGGVEKDVDVRAVVEGGVGREVIA